ncbi:hypothetical protein RYX36_035837 [Vicia faba]
MNVRPLRYSLVLDSHPDNLPHVPVAVAKRNLKLRDAVLSSFHHNENGAAGTGRVSYLQDIADPTLPANPRKSILYRPSLTHFVAVLATICVELPLDGVLLVYLSASGAGSSGAGHNESGCLNFGSRGDKGSNCICPSDFLPFTRRPLLLVIDNENSKAFKVIAEASKGESVAMLLSPSRLPPIASDFSHSSNGSLFTMFLTAPLQSFCLLLGFSGTDIDLDLYNKAKTLLSSSLNNWGMALASSDTLDPVWGQVLGDPFIKEAGEPNANALGS